MFWEFYPLITLTRLMRPGEVVCSFLYRENGNCNYKATITFFVLFLRIALLLEEFTIHRTHYTHWNKGSQVRRHCLPPALSHSLMTPGNGPMLLAPGIPLGLELSLSLAGVQLCLLWAPRSLSYVHGSEGTC